MIEGEKELIWVEKDFAQKYNKIMKDDSLNGKREEALEEYIEGVSETSRREFKTSLETIEEDAAIYKGLMLKVKQSFEKAKNESLDASYQLWENYEKELPSVQEKIKTIVRALNPLSEKLKEINESLNEVKTYNFEKLIELIEKTSSLYGKERTMFDFLIHNYKKQKETNEQTSKMA